MAVDSLWIRDSGFGNRDSGIGNRESGIGNRESGIGNRESGMALGLGLVGSVSAGDLPPPLRVAQGRVGEGCSSRLSKEKRKLIGNGRRRQQQLTATANSNG
ncbi:hypothetical protein EAT51_04455 [Pseudoxanthomonas winnipegensis]|nr:hypothetical protein EAT51_04455 [Pseudoxanthomonas winnipegensis]